MIKKTLRITSGIGLVVLGILGLILPIMPGWIFLIPGLVILGDYFPPVRRLVGWAKKKAEQAGVFPIEPPTSPPPSSSS